jgi:hypothetical protein
MIRRWVAPGLLIGLCGAVVWAAPPDDRKPAKPNRMDEVEEEVAPRPAKAGKVVAGGDDADDQPKFPAFDKFTKGAEVVTGGLMTLYKKDNHVYLELEQQHLNRPFLLPIAVARGAAAGGTTLNGDEEWVVLFKRVAPDRVQLIRRNTRYRGSGEISKAVQNQYLDSVLQALSVRAVNPGKGSVLIDLNDIFFSDFGQIGLGYLDSSRTTWGSVKSFKRNVELQVQATFGSYSSSFFGGFDGVIDPRGVTVVLHYGLAEMPEGGYQPRYADTRVGHFLTAVKDFGRDNPDTSFVRMINRWRLERADGSNWKEGGKLVPPKKRIVYWIEDTVPDEYRTAVREGILEWNKAFEKVGFKDAIEVRQQDGQEFDPEDISYATFRWITTDVPFAIGPSRANPLTGEILDADILFDASFVQTYKQEHRIYRDDKGRPVDAPSKIQALRNGWEMPFHPAAFRNSPFGWDDKAKPGEPPVPAEARHWQRLAAGPRGYCQCAAHKRSDLALARFAAALLPDDDEDEKPAKRKADDEADEEKPKKDAKKKADDEDEKPKPDGKAAALEKLLQQAVKEVTMHEVGHTLGLRHNFKASTMLPNDKLNDVELTRKKGMVGSVMDYNPANIAPKGVKQGDYFTTTLGPYDYWAIEYAYKPVAGGPDGEKAELDKVAKKAPNPDLVYGTDEDLYGSLDPYINLFDLGADPLQYGKDRVKLAEGLLPKLADTVVDKGESYARLRLAFGMLLGEYANAAYLASGFVGGTVVNRTHKGDGKDPLEPVAGDKQREALKYLQTQILSDKPFQFPAELLRKLGDEKWYHWGEYGLFFGGGGEYPVNERVLSIQRIPINYLLSGSTLKAIQNQARTADKKLKPLAVSEVFRALTDSVFADLPAAGKEGDDKAASGVATRNLQRAYVQKLAELVLGPKTDFGSFFVLFSGGGGSVPADAKALARFHLKEIGERVKAGLKGDGDDTTKAHLQELQERVAKVLDARPAANE